MFFKIGALKNFANLTGKHLCWSLFLIKLQAQHLSLQKTSSAYFLIHKTPGGNVLIYGRKGSGTEKSKPENKYCKCLIFVIEN